MLLVRELDVAPDRDAARLGGAQVGGLHDPGAAAGDDAEAGLNQVGRGRAGGLVHRRVARRPRGAEHGDRQTHLCEPVEPVDELRGDAVDPPRVGVQEARVLALEQVLVCGAGAGRRRLGHGGQPYRRGADPADKGGVGGRSRAACIETCPARYT